MKREQAEEHLRAAGVQNPAALFEGLEWTIWSGNKILGKGATLRLALESAGHPPPPPPFEYFGGEILCGAETVARARSVTMARRIVNALNLYKPGPKGY